MQRRDFIKYTTMGMGVFAGFHVLPSFATDSTQTDDLVFFATNWGYQGTLPEFVAEARALGYQGVEVWLPGDDAGAEELVHITSEAGMKLALLAGGSSADFAEHLDQYAARLDRAITLQPEYINCHAGKDYFRFEDNLKIIRHGLEVAQRSGIPVLQETHRSRMLFAAPVFRQYAEAEPGLRLTLDISHWCNVHESLLADQKETIALALDRSDHIHARIGHPEGPQITHPDAPEWRQAVEAHLAWWDEIVASRRMSGKRVTITPEFGPPGYMPMLPFTGQPLADNWKVNARMLEILSSRYGN